MNVEATRFETDNAPIHQDTISVIQETPEQEIADHGLQDILYTASGELGIATRAAAMNMKLIDQEITTAEAYAAARAALAHTAADQEYDSQVIASTYAYQRTSDEVAEQQRVISGEAKSERSVARHARAEQIRRINEEHAQNMRRITFAENRKLDLTKLRLIEARRQHEAETDASDAQLKAKQAAIEAVKQERLNKLETERNDNTDFYKKCEKVIQTISTGIEMHHVAHDEATRAIRIGLDNLANAQTQIIETLEILEAKTAEYDELVREYDAHEQTIAELRKLIPKLMRQKNDKSDELYSNRRALEDTTPRSPDDINAAVAQFEDDQYTFHTDQVSILKTVTSVEEEIAQLKADNQLRNQRIQALRNHINACTGTVDQLQKDQALYEQEISKQEAKRAQLTPSARALEDRIDIVHKLQRKEYDTFESVPLQFRTLAQAALKTEIVKPEDYERIPDFATSIPGFDRPVLKIDIAPEEMPIFYMESKAPASNEELVKEAEVRYSSFMDVVADANTQFDHVRDWFKTHVGSGLVEAAQILPQGLLSRGMTVRVKGQDN